MLILLQLLRLLCAPPVKWRSGVSATVTGVWRWFCPIADGDSETAVAGHGTWEADTKR